MADSIVSLVSTCLQPIWSSAYQVAELELKPICGYKKEVEELKSRFYDDIEEAISKAENVHLHAILEALVDPQRNNPNETVVRKWLLNLKEEYYEVDDVVDKWNTATLISEIEDKVCCFIPSFYAQRLSLQREIAFHMKCLNEKLHSFETFASKNKHNIPDLNKEVIGSLKPVTSSWDRAAALYGRDMEKKLLMGKLLNHYQHGTSPGNKSITIPIVGMGGVGKTALAQDVFSDEKVKSHFGKNLCWVSVPYNFDLTRVAKSIIEAVQGRAASATDFHELDNLLRDTADSISGKKFLLVLDDVWKLEERAWNQLIATIENSHEASRILVTTQKYDIVKMMGASSDSVIHLDLLSDNDCRSILRQRQIGDICSELVRKCNGSPLVAHTLKNTEGQQDRLLLSELGHVRTKLVLPFLLNYYDLYPLEKRCFSYCSVLPRNYEIEKDDIVELWMSQGYLGVNENSEKTGEHCFKILASRYLFQDQSTKDYNADIIKGKVHDIVHEFAHFLTAHERVVMEIQGADDPKSNREKEEARHLTLSLTTSDARFPSSMNNKKNLRTLIVVRSETSTTPLSCDFLVKLTCLRTLNLQHCNIERLPEEINKLVHLRYLNLSGNDSLSQLPRALCYLFNLLTLRLKGCTQLQRLPEEMGNLRSLRQLYVEGCDSLEALPREIQKLTNLRTLDMFVVPSLDYLQNAEALKLEDLNTLQYLQGCIHIFRCGNLEDKNDLTQGAKLVHNDKRVNLKLNFEGSRGVSDEVTILEALQPHPELASLEIRGVRGTSSMYPTWMGSLTCLTKVVFGGWRNSKSLPPLGKLPSLESLQIDDMDKVEEVGLEFLGIPSDDKNAESFPKLRQLHFNGLPGWKKWQCLASSGEEVDISIVIMPCLASLQISQCGSLEVLPSFLKRIIQLEKLNIDQCNNLKPRCREGAGEEWDKISLVPNIKIDGQTIRPRSLVAAQASTSGSA